MTRQEILDKISKVKALADRGTEGEKINAEKMLKSLMDKYGIKDEDIIDDKVELYLIDTESEMFIQLLVQVSNSVSGKDLKMFNLNNSPKTAKKELSKLGYGDATANVAIECTKAQFLEIKMMFDIDKQDLNSQLDVFMYAYFSKNGLLAKPKEGEEHKQLTEEELNKIYKAAKMAYGIDKKQIYKMIENE